LHKAERERRKQLRRTVKTEELLRAEQELPVSKPALEALFDWLDQKLGETDCDDTLHLTLEFAKLNGTGRTKTVCLDRKVWRLLRLRRISERT
jgi:hypothetical protein